MQTMVNRRRYWLLSCYSKSSLCLVGSKGLPVEIRKALEARQLLESESESERILLPFLALSIAQGKDGRQSAELGAPRRSLVKLTTGL